MKRDIVMARELGADGIVTGLLLPGGNIDVERTSELVRMAGAMDVTFHRAFDMCADLMLALVDVYQTGIRRVLTSGGRNPAPEGLEILDTLTARAGTSLTINAGRGSRGPNTG